MREGPADELHAAVKSSSQTTVRPSRIGCCHSYVPDRTDTPDLALRVAEYPRVHTASGLREEAERCFRLAARASDKTLRDELLAYGKELNERAEKIEATERARASPNRERPD